MVTEPMLTWTPPEAPASCALAWLAVLWALIVGMIVLFRRADRTAALLQIPYLLWVTFAAYLNFGVWVLN